MPTILVEMASREGQREIAEAFKSIKDPVIAAAGVATEKANIAQSSAATAVQAKDDATSIATALTAFLETKETLTAPAVDTTLSVPGAAADAKVTGDTFKEAITNMGAIPSCDLNDLSDTYGNIVGLLVDGNTYTNPPYIGFTGTIFSIKLSIGTTVQFAFEITSGTVYYRKKTAVYTPPWIDWVKVSDMIAGGLPNNTNLNTITNNSVYGFNYGFTYNNLPKGVVSIAGILSTYRITSNLQFQTIHATYPWGKQYIRQCVGGTWAEWFETGKGDYAVSKKYVAFGDSLTWGAVWPATQGQTLYQAAYKYQIPTRIALATGLIDNFVNEGVGGIGYVHASGGQTITSKILNYDFTGVELVTIMGGANDATYPGGEDLGSADSSTVGDGTICGAIKSIINYIKTNYSKTQIVFIQLPPCRNYVDQWGTPLSDSNWSLNDFDREVSKICHDSHVGYVNWWESMYCDTWSTHSGGYNGDIGPNYSHPKAEGDYALLGDFIGGKVSTLIKGLN